MPKRKGQILNYFTMTDGRGTKDVTGGMPTTTASKFR
jgi:hypothetical protein